MTTPRELRAAVKRTHRAFVAAHGRGPRRQPLLRKLRLRHAYEDASKRYHEAVQQEAAR